MKSEPAWEMPCPVIGICGYSGSGKTTLIEALIPLLRQRGLRVAVVKQDAHGLLLDHPGKDSDRFFQAGADVVLSDPNQQLSRRHGAVASLEAVLQEQSLLADIILVEGHKTAPLPDKLWLCKAGESGPPAEVTHVQQSLAWNTDRIAAVLSHIEQRWVDWMQRPPVIAGVLIGGGSRRMGRPKHLLEAAGRTWLEQQIETLAACVDQVVILGRGEIPVGVGDRPVLPDVIDTAVRGPLCGMLTAMRWAPRSSWLFVACDQPGIQPEAIQWVLDQRRPGLRAILPTLADAAVPEPFPGWYDFRLRPQLEQLRRPLDLVGTPGIIHPAIPPDWQLTWRNLNTPTDLI